MLGVKFVKSWGEDLSKQLPLIKERRKGYIQTYNFMSSRNRLIFLFEFIVRAHSFNFKGTRHSEVAAFLTLDCSVCCVRFCSPLLPFCISYGKKHNPIFYFMPGSLLACVLVNPLWPQQQDFCQVLVTSMATAVTMVSAILPQHHQSA